MARACAKQLKEKNPKTRVAVFGLLRELIGVAPAPVAQELPLLVPGITAALKVGVRMHLACVGPSAWAPHIVLAPQMHVSGCLRGGVVRIQCVQQASCAAILFFILRSCP